MLLIKSNNIISILSYFMGNTISGGKEKQKNNEIEALGGNNVYKWSKRTEKLTKKETEKYNN